MSFSGAGRTGSVSRPPARRFALPCRAGGGAHLRNVPPARLRRARLRFPCIRGLYGVESKSITFSPPEMWNVAVQEVPVVKRVVMSVDKP